MNKSFKSKEKCAETSPCNDGYTCAAHYPPAGNVYGKSQRWNCPQCLDTGVYMTANGADDFDWEECDCGFTLTKIPRTKQELIERAKNLYLKRKGEK